MEKNEYCSAIDCNPRIRVSDFKRLIQAGRGSITFLLGGLKYTATYNPDRGELLLLWRDRREQYRQEIRIEQQESNLIKGKRFFYFICPLTSERCLKLYNICNIFRGRKSFRHHYLSENRSHYARTIYAVSDPYRPYGKRYYKGKITPYGKRVEKYEQREERLLRHLQNYGIR